MTLKLRPLLQPHIDLVRPENKQAANAWYEWFQDADRILRAVAKFVNEDEPYEPDIASDADVRSSATGDKQIVTERLKTSSDFVTLSEVSGAVALDWGAFINGVVVVDQATVISNPTNGQPGTYRCVLVKGNNSTDRTITFDTQFLGEVPTITDCDSDRWYDITIKCYATDHFAASAKRVKG